MDVGKLEWLLNGNRHMHALLKEKKYRVKYREFPGGHNYTSWRNDIWRGLEGLYRIG
jgi:enterochelin esterase family protein